MTDVLDQLRFMERSASLAAAPVIKTAADEIERLRALLRDALDGLHNDFEPDNQSTRYKRIKTALDT